LYFSASAARPQRLPTLEGNKPYTPTRLEWFAVNLNASLRVDLSMSTGYGMQFIPLSRTNLPSVNLEIMNTPIETAKQVISIEAKSRGWSSWLKVTEHVEMGKDKADKQK
jgi:hypothetical protein